MWGKKLEYQPKCRKTYKKFTNKILANINFHVIKKTALRGTVHTLRRALSTSYYALFTSLGPWYALQDLKYKI